MNRNFLPAAALAAALAFLAPPRTAAADVATVFGDLRDGVEQRIDQYEGDPAQKKVVKTLRLVSASLAAPKGRLAKDAKTFAGAVRSLESVAPGDGLLAPAVQRGVDEFLLAATADQQAFDAFVRSMSPGAKRRRAEKAAAKLAATLSEFDAAPTQSARMDVLRRGAAAADQGFKLAGARKGFFVVATVGESAFASTAPVASLGDSGDALAPFALAVSAASGPAAKAHRVIEFDVDLLLLGPGVAMLGMTNSGTFSSCPGKGGACAESTTGMTAPGAVQIARIDDGYGMAWGTFDFSADDGQGGITNVSAGAFRIRYR